MGAGGRTNCNWTRGAGQQAAVFSSCWLAKTTDRLEFSKCQVSCEPLKNALKTQFGAAYVEEAEAPLLASQSEQFEFDF